MNKFDGLLTKTADEFNIKRGSSESAEEFKSRIIYSVICRLSYACLWDNTADRTISSRHFKNRIDELLKIYSAMYPEVTIFENLSAEVYDLYLKAGSLYHKPHRISASMFYVAEKNDVLFLRGAAPRQKVFISGAGFYLPARYKNSFDESKFKTFFEMFSIQDKTLSARWNEITRSADWKSSAVSDDAEFLRMQPPFNKGYWQKDPIRDGRISLMRNGQIESKNYYLYKFEREKFLCSRLADWLVHDEFFSKTAEYETFRGGTYRKISCACLNAYHILPAIKFKLDGAVVQTKFEYLPPPEELYLLTLYSWAKNAENLPSNFERIFDAEIFFALKDTLEKIGYKFSEE